MQLEPTGSLENRHEAPLQQDRVCTKVRKKEDMTPRDSRFADNVPGSRKNPVSVATPFTLKGRGEGRTLNPESSYAGRPVAQIPPSRLDRWPEP